MGRRSIADIRREEIIRAFYKVVSEKGYRRATIREIAKVAGCSYRMIHHYFSNKEEIVIEVLEYVTKIYMSELRKGILEYDTATERLKFMFSYFNDLERFTLDFCRAWVECWALAKTHPTISAILQGCYNELKEMIAGFIGDGMKSGEFREVDPFITANLILATCDGVTMLWAVNTENTPIEAVSGHIPEYCLSYLRKKG